MQKQSEEIRKVRRSGRNPLLRILFTALFFFFLLLAGSIICLGSSTPSLMISLSVSLVLELVLVQENMLLRLQLDRAKEFSARFVEHLVASLRSASSSDRGLTDSAVGEDEKHDRFELFRTSMEKALSSASEQLVEKLQDISEQSFDSFSPC